MKIFCIGRNYADHAKELNNDIPDEPLIFMKPPTALLRNGQALFHPIFSQNIHYEIELVLHICKNGKYISTDFARRYYDQITVGIDFTARDLQEKLRQQGNPWEIAKGFDGSAAIGEWQPLSPDMPLNNLEFSLKKNDKTVQKGNSADLIFSFDVLVSHISHYFTLQKGDVIFTGTPKGVGKVDIDDELEGFLGDKKLLHCFVK